MCIRKLLSIPKSSSVLLQLGPWPERQQGRPFSIVVNSQQGRYRKALSRLNSSSFHCQTQLPPDWASGERLNPDKAPERDSPPPVLTYPCVHHNQTFCPKWLI